jgi:putative peptidoglycan lipid II flippase
MTKTREGQGATGVVSGATVAGSILQRSLGVSTVIVVVKATALVKEMAVAFYFGTSGALDAYLIAFLLPALAVNVFGASFQSAMVPALIGHATAGREVDRPGFISACFARYVLALILFTAMLGAIAPIFIDIAGYGFSPAGGRLATHLVYFLLPVFFFGCLSAFFTAILAAEKKFLMAAAVPAVTSVTTIIFLAVLADQSGIDALAVGVVIGFAVEAVILAVVVRFTTGWRPRLIARQWSEEAKGVFRHTRQIAIGAALMSGAALVDQSVATWLDEGAVASLAYATRLTAVLLTVAASLSTVSLPYFSELAHGRDWPALRGTMQKLTAMVLLGSAVLIVGVVVFSEPIVALIFERGLFSDLDTRNVAWVQAIIVVQLPFYVLVHIGMRLLYAMNRGKLVVWISAAIFSANLLGDIVFMPIWGIAGIALATVISYLIGAVLVLRCAWNQMK